MEERIGFYLSATLCRKKLRTLPREQQSIGTFKFSFIFFIVAPGMWIVEERGAVCAIAHGTDTEYRAGWIREPRPTRVPTSLEEVDAFD